MMNWRIVSFLTWWAAAIAAFLCSVFLGSLGLFIEKDSDTLVSFPLLVVGLGWLVVFLNELPRNEIKAFRALPVSNEELLISLWGAVVVLPIGIVSTSLITAWVITGACFRVPLRLCTALWPVISVGLCVNSAVFYVYTETRMPSLGGDTFHRLKLHRLIGVTFVGIGILSLMHWNESHRVRALVSSAAIPGALLPIVLLRSHRRMQVSVSGVAEDRGIIPGERKARLYSSRWASFLASPFGAVLKISPLVAVLWAPFLLRCARNPNEAAFRVPGEMYWFLSVFLCLLTIPWITSMRVFGVLPISRMKQALICSGLALCASLPVLALALSFEFLIPREHANPGGSLAVFSMALCITLALQAAILRGKWDLFFLLVFALFLAVRYNIWEEAYQHPLQGIALGAVFIAVVTFIMWGILEFTDIPYRRRSPATDSIDELFTQGRP